MTTTPNPTASDQVILDATDDPELQAMLRRMTTFRMNTQPGWRPSAAAGEEVRTLARVGPASYRALVARHDAAEAEWRRQDAERRGWLR